MQEGSGSRLAPEGTGLLSRLGAWTRSQPDKIALAWLDETGHVSQSMSYSEIDLQSSRLAAHLSKRSGLSQGSRVLLVYPPSLQFIVAFLACLKAGLIAVPTFPPDPSKLNKDVQMFGVIASSCGAKVALTSTTYSLASKLATVTSSVLFAADKTVKWPELDWIVTDDIMTNASLEWRGQERSSDVAFLQYTSGSTSEPKGVIITQEALAHNLTLIITGLSATSDTVVVSWLPQYHDMGLIGSFLGAMYCGGCGFYMSPISFIRNPVVWISCMSKYRATHVQAPNFAYALTARKFLAYLARNSKAPQQTYDLSSVRHMINAAEPVEASSIDLFYAVFGKYGLKPNVIFPTYGLAEHCVYVCSNGKERLVLDKVALERDRRVKTVVQGKEGETSTIVILGCGRPCDSASVDLKIVDTEGLNPLPEGRVGEIWIKSMSMAAGYWGLEEKTKEDFAASLSEDLGEGSIHGGGPGGFLRTGDLGFLYNGEVFICGRLKDLIIVRGRNHYPQDIERTAESIASVVVGYDEVSLRGGCSAAFSVPIGGQEMLVYAAEVSCTKISADIATGLIDRIRAEVSRVHGVSPSVILLLEPRTIPKTTSGKIARQWARRAYLDGTLKILDSWSGLDVQGNDGIEASAAAMEGPGGGVIERDEDAIDPTGQPLEFVLEALKKAVSVCTEQPHAFEGIAVDVPLMNLGMDSLRGVQLQCILERKFTVPLPDELMFEPDATLRTIGNALVAGGVVRPRPFMLNSWDVISAVRKLAEKTPKGRPPPSGPLPQQWFRERRRSADVDTHTFPDGCATPKATLGAQEERSVVLFSSLVFSGPLIMLLCCLLVIALLPLKMGLAAAAVIVCASLVQIDLKVWPAYFRRSALLEFLARFFSLRIVIERPVDMTTPAVFAVGPGTPLPFGSIIMCMISEFFLGSNVQPLLAKAMFRFPLAGAFFRLISCLPNEPETVRKALAAMRHVCVGFDGATATASGNSKADFVSLPRNKDFIQAAIEQGAQIIPCYCFGSSLAVPNTPPTPGFVIAGTQGSFLPLLSRTPLLMVIGRPIACPKVEKPTLELVNEFNETYCREIRRIFDKFKNAHYDRQLEIKR